MISKDQMERAEKEFSANANAAFEVAREAERELESYTYGPRRDYDPAIRERKLQDFRDADYMAESRAWILALIKKTNA